YYDPVGQRFLPDRYVEGKCPHCGFDAARGDQCEHCGTTLDATDLIEPRSKISGAVPELRSTEHFYFRYSDFTERVGAWLKTRQGWRPHVLNSATGWTNEGLQDRAITRDLDWGVELPVDDLGEGKRIYVWYDAVIGYLSASKEWAARNGDAEAWKRWWHNDDARHLYFVGKDNIPFHTLLWPAQLMGYGGLHLPDDVPANQYVTFSGAKMAAGRGVGLTIGEGLRLFEPDALRYALGAALPEHADTEVSVEEIARRINDELVATWGNLVHRVFTMVHAKLGGTVPETGERPATDTALLAAVDDALTEGADCIERVELRAGLRTAMGAAAKVNAYLNSTEPWKLASSEPDRAAAVLVTALEAVAGVRTGLAPYLPFSTEALDDVFGPVKRWERPTVPPGTSVPKPTPLFAKVDLDAIDLAAQGAR
ncbi:MAG: class I tRNA ligase family protein, partial [Acidimicrobiaceae bacterium]|nr:class I tRNA ligase family protein [Acidimicrobiaceae bacterium]